jgi:benzoyl-CoA reductase subunit C
MSVEVDPLLAEWRTLANASPGETATRWKRSNPGRRCLACYPVWAPAEIVHAAGMLPIAILGGGASVELTHADSRFQSFVCSIAKSTLELAFQGRVRGVDGFIFSNVCDVARNLSSLFARNFPDVLVEYLHLPQGSEPAAAVEFAASELRRLAACFECDLGEVVTESALTRSIEAYNALRSRLRALYALRIESPERLPTTDLYLALRASTQAPPEESVARIDALLDRLPRREARRRDRIRVVLEGTFCEQPPIGLLEILEEAGCYVVEDDLLLGWRWFTEDVSLEGDPFEALGAAYVNAAVASSTRHDGREHRSRGPIERVRRSRADAVVFLLPKFCEPALFDYVLIKQGLEREGIPQLALEFEEKTWTFERTRTEIETFVESMLFE